MWIMVSGPYTSGGADAEKRAANLRAMNDAAVVLRRAGHVPVVGVNMALPMIDAAGGTEAAYDEIMMPVSLALADRCDACLRVSGPSKGADDEAERFVAAGRPVYRSLAEVPGVRTPEQDARTATGRPRASVEVREATEADRGFLFSLAPRLAGVPRPDWHGAAAMAAFQDRFMAATLGAPAEGAVTLVAFSGEGQRLGYIHAHPGRDGVTDEPCGHVAIVALEAEAEGLGAAGRLMARAEDWARARGHRLLSLDVFASNRRALDFYARGGFRPETIRLVKPL